MFINVLSRAWLGCEECGLAPSKVTPGIWCVEQSNISPQEHELMHLMFSNCGLYSTREVKNLPLNKRTKHEQWVSVCRSKR